MKLTAYYNDIDPFCCAWLSNLMDAGLITPGVIDNRSIADVTPDDVAGFTRVGFFAGIGGWDLALQLAGWPDDKPIWHGSPPCQPFSCAGKQLGTADDRHLAPHWLALVAAVRPPFVAGEQVAAAINKDAWLDDLLDALEREGYTTGAAVLPACGFSAPHIRQRIFFVGRLADSQRNKEHQEQQRPEKTKGKRSSDEFSGCHSPGRLADAGLPQREPQSDERPAELLRETIQQAESRNVLGNLGAASCGVADADSHGRKPGSEAAAAARHGHTADAARGANRHGATSPATPGWNAPDWLLCRDGKWRPVESRHEPLADGLPDRLGYSRIGGGYSLNPLIKKAENRVGRLRGYGNAIVPQIAAEILKELL